MRRILRHLIPALALFSFGFAASAFAKPAKSQAAEPAETLLEQAVGEISSQRFASALQHIDALIRIKPNFRLAYLIRGDLLLARARPLATLGDVPKTASAERVAGLRDEAIVRLRALKKRPSPDLLPRYLLQLRREHKYAIVADTSRSRLYVFLNEDGQPRLVSDYYISSGKGGDWKVREGDEKTPIGVYHVTASLPRQKLSDFYGTGAFPINYPNDWDRMQGRNGHGIWLHGTPSDTYSRPPRASNGCVVLSNSDLDALAQNLQIGLTPVIISDDVEWVPAEELRAQSHEFAEQLDRWRGDWESMDANRYLAHYSRSFYADGRDLSAWSRHKRQVAAAKSWIKVSISNVGIFRNPGKEALVVVTFNQDYRSSNLSNVMKKRQYWLRESGRWRIVHEGPG